MVWQLHSTCLIQRSCACGTAVIRPGIPRKKGQSSPGSTARHMISDIFFYIYILCMIFYLLFPKVQEWKP